MDLFTKHWISAFETIHPLYKESELTRRQVIYINGESSWKKTLKSVLSEYSNTKSREEQKDVVINTARSLRLTTVFPESWKSTAIHNLKWVKIINLITKHLLILMFKTNFIPNNSDLIS